MNKIEKLKAAAEAADAAAWAAHDDVYWADEAACDAADAAEYAAWGVAKEAWGKYKAELKKLKENSND
jgi:hypothetical protein